jgi:hypothetical protein
LFKWNTSGSYTFASCTEGPAPQGEIGNVKGNIDEVSVIGDGSVNIRGWACVEKFNQSIGVHLYSGNSSGGSGALFVAGTAADIVSEASVSSACATTGSKHRFLFQLSKTQAEAHAGKRIYVHGLHPDPSGSKNITITGSGSLVIPFSSDSGGGG